MIDNGRAGSRPRLMAAARVAVPLAAVVVLGIWTRLTPEGLLGKADAIGYAVCHRIDARSFHLGDRPLPLCSRCTGMYLGAALSLAYLQVSGRQGAGGYPDRRVRPILGVFGLAFVADSVNSLLQAYPGLPFLYPAQNEIRLATGLLGGIALGAYVYPAFQQTVWKHWRQAPALRGPADLAWLGGLGAFLYFAVASENPLLLYSLAIASSLSALVLLSVVFAALVLTAARRENRFTAWRELSLPLASGLGLALVQIGVFDLVRFSLTGSWNGFTL